MLRVFVYGTLKRGYGNHGHCSGYDDVKEASVFGKLYTRGIPYLVTPPELNLAAGTRMSYQDMDVQNEYHDYQYRKQQVEGHGQWPMISGELFYFENPSILKNMDYLEGFNYEQETSHYNRVLIPVCIDVNEWITAWAYVVDQAPANAELVLSGSY